MLNSTKAKMAGLLLGILAAVAAGTASAITFNHFTPTVAGILKLTVKTTGTITTTGSTQVIPFNFSTFALSCPMGITISTASGMVSCADKTLPVCTLSATPASVAPGSSVNLTASCSNTPTSFQWTASAGLTAGSGNAATATVTVPANTVPGVYAYSVTASNGAGTGNVASAVVKVGGAGQSGPYAYIAHQDSAQALGVVSVIDIPTGSLTPTTIPAGVYPTGVAVNAAGTRTYVSNGDYTVSVLDTATNKVIATIPVGISPVGVAVNPRGTRVYVANSRSNNVSVIDTATNSVIATPNVGTTPFGVAVSQDGTRVYVANSGSNNVSVIDTATNTVIATPSVGTTPYRVAVNPRGTRVFVTNSGSDNVSVIDAGTNTVMDTPSVGSTPKGIDIDPDGKKAYVVNYGDRTVSVIDVATLAVIDTVVVGMMPESVSFNPTGALAYVTNQGDNTVSVIDTAMNSANLPAIQVPGGGLYAFGKFIATANAINPGMWFNPDESGWGATVTQHGNMIFNAFYTYDDNNQPTWYTMSSCPLIGWSCTGDIQRVTGGTPPMQAWSGAVKPASVGSGTLTFTDANSGTLYFTINGVSGSKKISRFVFATGATPPSVDYTDLWWNPNESGWGVALTQQYGMMFAAWYAYDASGNPIWYVASSCPVVGSGCTGDLYQVTGGASLTSAWKAVNPSAKVGTVTFAFSDANNGKMSYSINNVAGSRNITRQGF